MATFEEIREFRNNNNKFASYLGIWTTEIRKGFAAGEMTVQDYFENAVSSVHGGCIFALADTIGGAAAASYGYRMTTVSGDFHYLSPAMEVKQLRAVAKEIKCGKRMFVCDVEIVSEQEKLSAKGTFSYYNLGVPLL